MYILLPYAVSKIIGRLRVNVPEGINRPSLGLLTYMGKKTLHGLEDQSINHIKWEERHDGG